MSTLVTSLRHWCVFVLSPLLLSGWASAQQLGTDDSLNVLQSNQLQSRDPSLTDRKSVIHLNTNPTRSFYEVELTLTDSGQFDTISQDGSVLGLIDTRGAQVVLVLTERLVWLRDMGVTIHATEPPKERRPPASFESPAAAPGSDKIYGCHTNDGNELEWCSNSYCNTSDPYFYNGVDLDCGVLVGTYAWWRHYLPYSCAQSYNDLDVGFYGKGTSWPDNGASIFVYNWQTETWVEVWVNVGTDEGWHMVDVDHSIGKYISSTYHNVIVRLYASSTDCAYVRDVEVCYDYNEKPPICDVSPTTLNFPDTDIGSSSSPKTFTIENVGYGTLSGTVNESSDHFRVTASGGLSYSLGHGESKQFNVYFEPEAEGQLSCNIETGNSKCDDVYCQGKGIGHGKIYGYVYAHDGVAPVADVSIRVTGNGVDQTRTTLPSGYYEFNSIPYANPPYTVTPSYEDHVFNPPPGSGRYCYVNASNPECRKDFTDETMRTIAGKVSYSTCNGAPVEDVDIWLDGEVKDNTEADGTYSMSAYIGSHEVQAVKTGHQFLPPNPRTVDLQEDRLDIDFTDDTKVSVSGVCKTACDQGIEGVIVTLASTFCNVSADPSGPGGGYSIEVPPGTFTLCATHPEYTFDCSDPITLVSDTTYDFVYKTALRLVVETEDPQCNAIGKGEAYPYTILVRDELDCEVSDATVTITDEVSDTTGGSPDPVEVFLDGVSQFDYIVVGGIPQIDKILSMSVYKEGYDNDNNQGFATTITVTGRRFLGTTFTSKLDSLSPIMILYDPPGDMSYSYLEADSAFYSELGFSMEKIDETGLEVGAGVDLPFVQAGVEVDGKFTVRGTIGRRIKYEITNTNRYETEHSQPDGEPILKGPGHGTKFLTAGLNIVYGVATEISVDTSTCVVTTDEVFGLDIGSDQAGITSLYYSNAQIKRDILTDPVLPPEDSIIWENLIATDVSDDNVVSPEEEDRVPPDSCSYITWPGGGGQGSEKTTEVSGLISFESEIEIEASIAAHFGLKVYGVGAGGKVTVKSTLKVGSTTEIGFRECNTIGYWLEDNESSDNFFTKKCMDMAAGIPVFFSESGTHTMCPWEPFTSRNEDVDLINVTGVWDTTVICGDSAVIVFRLDFLGILPGGSYFKLWAPPALNSCGAEVLFNGQPGPLNDIHIYYGNPAMVTVSIIPTCACDADTVTIRAQSMCDPQIFSDERIIVHTIDTGIWIEVPPYNDTVSGLVDIVAKTNQHPIDGVKFFVKEQYEPGYYELCFDTTPDGGQAPFEYTCTWNSETWPSNKYYYIKACVIESGSTGTCDSVLVYLDNVCPNVFTTIPVNNGEYLGTISAEFTEELDETTIDCLSFLLYDNTSTAWVPCSLVLYSDRIAEFIPAIDIEQGHEYTATLTTDIRDLSGNTLCSEYSWTFTTGECVSWLATIEAQGEIVGDAPNLFDVKIGEDSIESTFPSPGPPPEYTTFIKLDRADWSGPYYQDVRQCGEAKLCWIVAVNPSGNVMPPQDRTTLLSWNPTQFKADGEYRLREGYDCTGPVVVSDMRLTNDYAVTGSNQDYYYTIEWSGEVCWDYDLHGWGLVSLPVTPDNFLTNYLFPDAEVAFEFDQTYAIADSMQPCNGYWLKMPLTDTVTVCGTPVNACIDFLSAGWHLRGGPFCTTTAITDPPGCVEAIFGFDQSYYLTTEFAPGRAYWVNLSDDCELRLECGSSTLFAKERASAMSTNSRCEVTIHAQGESLGGVSEANVIVGLDNTPDSVPAPPDPPEYSVSLKVYQPDWDGPFYQDIRMDTSAQQIWFLEINPHGSIMPPAERSATISWDPAELCDNYDFELREDTLVSGSIVISDMTDTTQLVVTGTNQVYYYTVIANLVDAVVEDVPNLPLMFRLYQSYPNPFNPSTIVEYDLPRKSNVNITVYNVLGQKVRTLVSCTKPAGQHSVEWDGMDNHGRPVTSGVYFYRIIAGEHTETRKMLLLK